MSVAYREAWFLTCEQVGALKIRGDFGNLREALKAARGVRKMPPPPWAGAYVRLTLHRESNHKDGGGPVRAWEYLASLGWRQTDPV